MVLQQLDHQRIGLAPFGQHHMRLDDLAAFLIRSADHRAFQHIRMRQQRSLHLWPRDIIARRDDHIIRPRGKVEPPVLILPETVARQVPAVAHVFQLPVIGQIAAARGSAHRQPPDLAARHFLHVLVHDPRLIPRHGSAGATRPVIVKAIGQEDMQHLGSANAVQHRLARLGDPLLIDRRGQSFPSTDGCAQAGQVCPFGHRLQHHPISRWRGETNRRLVCLDQLDHIRRRGLLQKRRSSPKAQREHRQTAQTKGKGQGRRAHEHILRRYPKNLTRIAVRDNQQVAVKGHRALRLAGGSAGKADQRHIIAPHRRCGKAHRFRQRHAVKFGIMVGGTVKADHGFDVLRMLGASDHFLHQPRVAERKGDLGLVDDLPQLARAQHRHGIDHHRPCLGRPQPAGHHRRVVGRADQHTISGLYAVIFHQRMRDPVRPVSEFFIGPLPPVADQRGMVAKAAFHHPVGQFHRRIHIFGIVKPLQPDFRPLIGRGKAVTRKAVDMARRSQHHSPSGTTAVASISTLARSSTKATTCTSAIAG